MYILNHSCKVEQKVKTAFIEWLNHYFGDYENDDNDFRYSQLLAPTEDDGTDVIIIQLFVDKVDGAWDLFLQEHQEKFQKSLFEQFNTQVLSFLTLMKVLKKQ